jgi:RsiW-degrading membrane proteinase PrsW (M82 family)
MNFLLYITLLALVTAFWGTLFYKKDYHPQPLKIALQSFGFGVLAMVPVFGYKVIYQNYVPRIAEYQIFRPLLDSALFSGFLFFMLNLMILAVVLFLLSGVTSWIMSALSRKTFTNITSSAEEESLGFTGVSLLIGLLILVETSIQNFIHIPIVTSIVGTILFLTVIEEYVKHLMVRFLDDKRLKDVDDAITLSIMVGLAFAFIENIIYAWTTGDASLIVYRALISIPIHIVASGIFGYFYGLAHFAKPILAHEKKSHVAKVMSMNTIKLYKDEKIAEGLCLATLFHALANVLLEVNMAYMTIPLLVIGLSFIFRLYKKVRIEFGWIYGTSRKKARA